MSHEPCCSRDDKRDIGSRRDPINKPPRTTTTDDDSTTARDEDDEDDEEEGNRAVEVVLPPPSPQVRVCELGEAMMTDLTHPTPVSPPIRVPAIGVPSETQDSDG